MYAGLYILHRPRSHDGLLVSGLHGVAALLAIWGGSNDGTMGVSSNQDL